MRKLALAALSFSASVFLCQYLLPASWQYFAAAAAAVLALAGLFFRQPSRLRIFIICLSLAVGFLWNTFYANLYLKPASALDGSSAAVSASALSAPEETEYGYKLPVAITQSGAPDIKALLYGFGKAPVIEAGDTLAFTARFKLANAVHGEKTNAYFAKGVFLMAYTDSGVTVTDLKPSIRYLPAYIADLSKRMVHRIFPDNTRDFMCALLLGDSSGVYSNVVLSSAMSSAGTAHIIAVSGMHLSFLVGFLNLIIKNKRRLAAAAIPAIVLFMAVVGFRPSLARAGIMQVFLLTAPLAGRENDTPTSLSASLMLILLINPYAATSAGLQLSFASVLGITLFSQKLCNRLNGLLRLKWIYRFKSLRYAVRFFIGGFATTIGALAFSVPLTALHFGTVSIIAPLTNLIILLPTALAFTGGMLALLLGFVFAPAGALAAFPATLTARLITDVTTKLSRLPFAALYTASPAAVLWLVYVWSMLLGLWVFRARLRQLLIPACLSGMSLCLLLVGSSLLSTGDRLALTALDVGQGQCIVLTSGKYTAVVDCGSVSGKDAGELLVRHLKAQGRHAVDLLILTHLHTDHTSGVAQVLERMPVSAVAIPAPSLNSGLSPSDIAAPALEKGTQIIYVTENLTAALGDMSLKLYAPVGTSDVNERGVVILATRGVFDALITGDISSETERRLLGAADFPDIEVLIAGHHGSKHATSNELLRAVTPEIVVISVGYNTYGHPARETLLKLAQAGILTCRTDIDGSVTIKAW